MDINSKEVYKNIKQTLDNLDTVRTLLKNEKKTLNIYYDLDLQGEQLFLKQLGTLNKNLNLFVKSYTKN